MERVFRVSREFDGPGLVRRGGGHEVMQTEAPRAQHRLVHEDMMKGRDVFHDWKVKDVDDGRGG
jgi:hypothetical protein